MNHALKLTLLTILMSMSLMATPVYAEDKIADSTATFALYLRENKSLANDPRVIKLERFLKQRGSTMAPYALHAVEEADRLGMDWKLIMAIAGAESTYGKFIPTNSYNAWGWGVFTGKQTGVNFANWKEGITKVSEGIRYNYMDKGAVTLEQIGRKYAASGHWSTSVGIIMAEIERTKMPTFASLEPTL